VKFNFQLFLSRDAILHLQPIPNAQSVLFVVDTFDTSARALFPANTSLYSP